MEAGRGGAFQLRNAPVITSNHTLGTKIKERWRAVGVVGDPRFFTGRWRTRLWNDVTTSFLLLIDVSKQRTPKGIGVTFAFRLPAR